MSISQPQLKQLLASDVCDVEFGVVVKKAYGTVVWAPLFNLTGRRSGFWKNSCEVMPMLGGSSSNSKRPLLSRQSDSMTLFGWNSGLALVFGCSPGCASRLFAVRFGVQNPLLISDANGVESGLETPEQQQRNVCLDMALALHFDQLMVYRL